MPNSFASTASRLKRSSIGRGEDFVERLLEQLARPLAVDGHVLVAVGNPDVGDAGLAQRPADGRADLAAGDAVLDPEAAYGRIAMGQGEAAGRQGMGEISGIEIHADAQPAGPVDPALEMGRLDLVAIDRPAAGVQIDGVQVEAMLAGDEAVGRLGVGAELVGGAGPAGVVAGGQDAAAGESAGPFEPAHVVPLPAVHGDGDFAQLAEGLVGIHAQLGVTLFGQVIGCFQGGGFHDRQSPLAGEGTNQKQ